MNLLLDMPGFIGPGIAERFIDRAAVEQVELLDVDGDDGRLDNLDRLGGFGRMLGDLRGIHLGSIRRVGDEINTKKGPGVVS